VGLKKKKKRLGAKKRSGGRGNWGSPIPAQRGKTGLLEEINKTSVREVEKTGETRPVGLTQARCKTYRTTPLFGGGGQEAGPKPGKTHHPLVSTTPIRGPVRVSNQDNKGGTALRCAHRDLPQRDQKQ